MDNPIGCVQHDCDECKRTADTIESQQAEIARVRKDCDNKAACLKYICGEWNEDCEPTCDSFCHDENCRSSNIGEAKKAMRLTIESQAARITALESALSPFATSEYPDYVARLASSYCAPEVKAEISAMFIRGHDKARAVMAAKEPQ